VPDGQPIEELPALLPLRHVAIHQADETCIVGRFEQMHHLVHHDVLKALSRFFGQIGVQANAGGRRIAAPQRVFIL
jgi:hypothetical protein